MQANATSDGITRDLEAMAETGIGGAYLMPIGHAGSKTIADPPANSLSPNIVGSWPFTPRRKPTGLDCAWR